MDLKEFTKVALAGKSLPVYKFSKGLARDLHLRFKNAHKEGGGKFRKGALRKVVSSLVASAERAFKRHEASPRDVGSFKAGLTPWKSLPHSQEP